MGAGQGIVRGAVDTPALSVTMTVYNGQRFLQLALDGLSAQTFRDFELIVVDDGSTDRTAEILTAHACQEPRMRIVRHPENRGLVPARNRALAACRAPLLAIADADDVFKPNRFERQIGFLAENADVGFCGTSVELIDGEGRQTGIYRPPQTDADIRFFSMFGGCFWNTTTMYRTALVSQAGGYKQAFNRGAEDYDLWVRLMQITRCGNLPDILACQRVHSTSVTADLSPTFKNQCAVASGLLATYLGRTVEEDQVADALSLYRYGWRTRLSSQGAASGLALLSEVSRAAASRESVERLATFRKNVALGLFEQSVVQLRSDRQAGLSHGLRMVREARRWDPSTVPARAVVGYAVRSLVPAAALHALRVWRGRAQPSQN